MLLETSVSERPATDVGRSFPDAELVAAAAALFARERVPDRHVLAADPGVVDRDGNLLPSIHRAIEFGYRVDHLIHEDRELVEGPRFYVGVGPGIVSVRRSDPVAAERAARRAVSEREAMVQLHVAAIEAGEVLPEGKPSSFIRSWSRKSRNMMVRRLAELDYAPLLDQGGTLAMLTLTYPGEWLDVAPGPSVCRRHVEALRQRFRRFYGHDLIGVWKREFQRRGAPHYHFLISVPADRNGTSFRSWVSSTWASIVGAARCDLDQSSCFDAGGCEYHRHLIAGTAVDVVEGGRYKDPKRAGTYFSKHGAYAAKEYQNEAPEEWEGESVGRFWGYWGLRRAVSGLEVAPDTYDAVSRTMSRWSKANRVYVSRPVWRKVQTVDRHTGEIGWRWRRRTVKVPVRYMERGGSGFMVVNDGPAFASQLARAAELQTTRRSGSGPVGFLP